MGRQILAALTRCGTSGPVAVVIDDAHWADVDSLRALLFALRRLPAHPVLTILVVPSDDARLPTGLVRLADGHTGATLDVGPLGVGRRSGLGRHRNRYAHLRFDRAPPVRPHAGQSPSRADAAG